MTLNVHFFISLFIALETILIDNIVYFFKINYLSSLIIATIINIFITYKLLKHKIIDLSHDFNKYDVLIFIYIFAIIVQKISTVDIQYDTKVYHLYLQTNPFLDKVNFDFFPGRIFCCFLFPLGDRINYIFRYLFGIRVGTLYSYYIIIIIFYQVKRCVKLFSKNENLNSIFSFLITNIYMINVFLRNLSY